jgi:gas vesicle protein
VGKIKGLLKTVSFGGLLGLVAGLLFAPQKGEDSRKKLQEAIEKGKEKFQELKEGINKGEGPNPPCCGS